MKARIRRLQREFQNWGYSSSKPTRLPEILKILDQEHPPEYIMDWLNHAYHSNRI